MVTKSFDCIDEVRRKLSQELKTGHRNSKERAIEISAKWARDAETRRDGFENVARETQRLL